MRVRALSSAFFFSLTIMAVPSSPAAARGFSGGVSASGDPAPAGGENPTGVGAPTTPAPTTPAPTVHIRTAPVTGHSAKLPSYKGPVFERTALGSIVPYQPMPASGSGSASGPTGGSPVGMIANARPELLVPGRLARFVNGLAAAPISAPAAVQEVVWAGNQIIGLPYIFGGGHASFASSGYDCSGTVSFALHGASLLAVPADSSDFMSWGSHGLGRWITIFSNPGHAYVDVAGMRLDTSAANDLSNQQGPRWRPLRPANGGYSARHPLGL